MGENIICPNCGASAKGYGICEYCGSHITKPMSTTTQTNQAKPTASFNEKVSKFHKVEAFDSGVAVVSIGDLYGAINESGDMIIPLKFNKIENYKGRLLASHGEVPADGATLYDSRGISIARGFILYIRGGDGEFLIIRDNRQSILDKDNNLHQVSLPEGISISKYLGYGCYKVNRLLNNERFYYGIALINKLLLPCHYKIGEYCSSEYGDFRKENRNLIIIEDEDGESVYRSGIYDLEKQKIILPCQYYFGSYGGPKQYKNKLIVVENRSWQYGVFDTHGQNMVIPTIYKEISLRENRVCVVTKKKLFGDKTTIIQL